MNETVTCFCGEQIRQVVGVGVSAADDVWDHVTGGDPGNRFFCYAEDDHLDPELRCNASPDPNKSAGKVGR